MYILNNEESSSRGILGLMPQGLRRYMYGISFDGAYEIRMRLGRPICVHYPDGVYYITSKGALARTPENAVRVTRAHIDEALEIATKSSVYSVRDEISNGFITVADGHRIGVTGTAVVKEDKISFIKDVSGLNYRLAGEVIGAADKVVPLIEKDGVLRNTLIISPPGAGKTTMLRDIVRQLSLKGLRVSVIDERREIAAMCEGRSAFDLGLSADVLEGADKSEGMLLMLRSMSPDVIVTDEIGTAADVDAIERVTNSGAAVVATIHGRNLDMVRRRSDLSRMLTFFDLVITLSKRRGIGTVEEVLEEW